LLRVVVRQLEMILPMLGSGSPAGKEVMKSLTSLGKLVPAGATSSGMENNAQQQLMMQQRQQAPMLAALRAQGQGGPTGSGMPLPGAGAPPGDAGAPPPSGGPTGAEQA
jgi:hypothetical protein